MLLMIDPDCACGLRYVLRVRGPESRMLGARPWMTKLPPPCPIPGVSAWLSLAFRAKLASGENVLILGATGVTGQVAVRIAKLLGAGRVVAAGRNQQVLARLHQLGADAIIYLDAPARELGEAFVREAGDLGFQVVIDYVWGHPTEAFLAAITRKEFAVITSEVRFVQVGESASPTIALAAAVLRSTALTILGTAGIPPRNILVDALQQVMAHAASGRRNLLRSRILRTHGNAINNAADW